MRGVGGSSDGRRSVRLASRLDRATPGTTDGKTERSIQHRYRASVPTRRESAAATCAPAHAWSLRRNLRLVCRADDCERPIVTSCPPSAGPDPSLTRITLYGPYSRLQSARRPSPGRRLARVRDSASRGRSFRHPPSAGTTEEVSLRVTFPLPVRPGPLSSSPSRCALVQRSSFPGDDPALAEGSWNHSPVRPLVATRDLAELTCQTGRSTARSRRRGVGEHYATSPTVVPVRKECVEGDHENDRTRVGCLHRRRIPRPRRLESASGA